MAEARIRDIEGKLANAEIIELDKVNANGKVVFGATVHLANLDDDSETRYQLVGEDEASIKNGLLSIASPIARALVGKQPGDVVEVVTPKGQQSFEITAVEYI